MSSSSVIIIVRCSVWLFPRKTTFVLVHLQIGYTQNNLLLQNIIGTRRDVLTNQLKSGIKFIG